MPENWVAEGLREIHVTQKALVIKLDRLERDFQDLERERIAHEALSAKELREMRDEYMEAHKNLEHRLDRLKLWAIRLLVLLILNLLVLVNWSGVVSEVSHPSQRHEAPAAPAKAHPKPVIDEEAP